MSIALSFDVNVLVCSKWTINKQTLQQCSFFSQLPTIRHRCFYQDAYSLFVYRFGFTKKKYLYINQWSHMLTGGTDIVKEMIIHVYSIYSPLNIYWQRDCINNDQIKLAIFSLTQNSLTYEKKY